MEREGQSRVAEADVPSAFAKYSYLSNFSLETYCGLSHKELDSERPYEALICNAC